MKIQPKIMSKSFWRPLSLLNMPNLCGLLRREAIKQNNLEKLKTHCPKVKQFEPMAVPVDNDTALPVTCTMLYTAQMAFAPSAISLPTAL